MSEKTSFKQPKPVLQTTSLWDFPSQHYGDKEQGDKDYAGVTPSYVIWNLLQRYTKPGDVVLDPMCGSGTTLDVCKDLGRDGMGYDLQPQRPEITKGDARSLPVKSGTVDFVFFDPPYSTHIEYSDDSRCIGQLEAHDPAYYESLEEVMAESFRVLKDGGYLGLYVADSFAKGKPFAPIGFELYLRLSALFQPVDVVVVTRHNKSLKRNHWHTSAIEGNYYLRGFNYLFIMRKNVAQDAQRLKHEDASYLSSYFKAAAKTKGEDVLTPERFSEVIESERTRIQAERPAAKEVRSERPARRDFGDQAARPPRRDFGDRNERPARSFGDRNERPARRDFGDQAARPPRRDFGDRNERPARSFGDRNERPARSFGDRNERPARSFGDRNERPARSFGDRNERPARSFGDRNERPARSFGDRNERPARSFGNRNERPRRDFGDQAARPPRRDFGDRNERPARSFGDRNERPRRDFGDQAARPPRRDFGDRNESPARSFGDRNQRPAGRGFGERSERPRRDFGARDERPARNFGDKPAGAKFSPRNKPKFGAKGRWLDKSSESVH